MSIKKLGEAVREIRKKRGVSLRKLAEKVDVSFVNLSHIENGRIKTSRETIKQIAAALNYDTDKLLSKAEEINDDLEKIINNKPTLVPQFLRTAKNLSKSDWEKVSNFTENLKKEKK